MADAITGVGTWLAMEAAALARSDDEWVILCGGLTLFLTGMAFPYSAGTGRFTDRVVAIRLATAVAFVVIRLAGDALSPEVVTVLTAVLAAAAGSVAFAVCCRFGLT